MCFQCLESPFFKTCRPLNALEGVQRHFTKRITVLRTLSYGESLACLELDTPECRRLMADRPPIVLQDHAQPHSVAHRALH